MCQVVWRVGTWIFQLHISVVIDDRAALIIIFLLLSAVFFLNILHTLLKWNIKHTYKNEGGKFVFIHIEFLHLGNI